LNQDYFQALTHISPLGKIRLLHGRVDLMPLHSKPSSLQLRTGPIRGHPISYGLEEPYHWASTFSHYGPIALPAHQRTNVQWYPMYSDGRHIAVGNSSRVSLFFGYLIKA
jgi:hypothetical protein